VRSLIAILVGIFVSGVAYSSQPSMIIIITHNDVETTNLDTLRQMGVNSYSLNIHGPNNLLKRLNTGNTTTDEVLLRQQLLQKLSTITEEERLSFFRPSILIKELGITKLPVAIYNNGEEVAYGVTDFLDALDIWEKTR